MRQTVGLVLAICVLWAIWYGLSEIGALPQGLRFSPGEYGALLGGRR